MHAGARAGFRMGARACVGLPPAGREAGRVCGWGRLSLGLAALGRLDLGLIAVLFWIRPAGLDVRLLYGRMLSCEPAPLCAEKQGLNNYCGH